MVIRFDSEALRELREAAAWYRERAPAAAQRFFEAVQRFFEAVRHSVDAIREQPEAWAQVPNQPGERRYVMQRYPFTLVYRIESGDVLVLAVAHSSRRPAYWSGR